MNGLFSVPIISIFLVGIIGKRAPAIGAKIAVALGMVSYSFFSFVGIEGMHWLHGYAISFLIAMTTLVAFGVIQPRSEDQINAESGQQKAPVDMTPWRYAPHASGVIVVLTVVIYIALAIAAS